jgi:hypothetical protein
MEFEQSNNFNGKSESFWFLQERIVFGINLSEDPTLNVGESWTEKVLVFNYF